MAAAPTLEDELLRVEGDLVEGVLLDLGELTFLDSSGLRLLLRATTRAKQNGHRLAIVGVGGGPRKVLEITDTERVLIDDTEGLPLIERFTQGEGQASRAQEPGIGDADG